MQITVDLRNQVITCIPCYLQSCSVLEDRLFERGFQLIVLPPDENGFSLHKGDLCDAVCLHYGCSLPYLLTECICATFFTGNYFSLVPTVVIQLLAIMV